MSFFIFLYPSGPSQIFPILPDSNMIEDGNEMAWTRDPDGRDTESTDDWKYLASSRGF